MVKDDAKAEAEAKFKRKQGRATEASQATSDYHAAARATREKTTRLRELREAKEATDKTEKPTLKAAPARPRASEPDWSESRPPGGEPLSPKRAAAAKRQRAG